jgi:hypothetical protein
MKDTSYGLNILVVSASDLVGTYLKILPGTQCAILAYFTY